MAIVFPKLQERTIKTSAVRETVSNIDNLAQNLSKTGQKELLEDLLAEIQQIEQEAREMRLINDNGTPRIFKQGKYENYLATILPSVYKKYEKIYLEKNQKKA